MGRPAFPPTPKIDGKTRDYKEEPQRTRRRAAYPNHGETLMDALRNTFQQAIMPDPNGPPRLADRFEVEVLDDGQIRWNLWHAGHRIYSATVDRGQIPAVMQATGQLANTTAIAREEGIDDAQTDE